MGEENEINWDEVIDYRFLEIEAELSVLNEYSKGVERQLPAAVKIETERLETEIRGLQSAFSGRLTIAQRFIAGMARPWDQSP